MISQQEHEAWEVLLACQGQLRLAPSGHAVGIEWTGHSASQAPAPTTSPLSELLPAAETGLIEAIRAGEGRLTEV